MNLSTVTESELETLITAWGFPKFRSKQVWQWLRHHGVLDPNQMNNVPKALRERLQQYAKPHTLTIVAEQVSNKDGTIKRAYQCHDGQLIESVLMPYDNHGRNKYTACISSQAGCAQGCVFCATGQMGLSRQLTADEIVEQVARFSTLLQQQHQNDDEQLAHPPRLSHVVFMGMGEPLANYRNVVEALHRITNDFGIGARRIMVSTVGIVPNIRKLTADIHANIVPPVRLAVSLHCATDAERDALIPANRKYGGLQNLMTSLHEYIETVGRRITLEWALVAGQNDSIETARTLGRLITKQYQLRRDMVHVNVIPLNPTTGYKGKPSQRNSVNAFVKVLQDEFGVACTPRVRRGIDIDAGCGQLTSKIVIKVKQQNDQNNNNNKEEITLAKEGPIIDGVLNVVDADSDIDYEDPELDQPWELDEASRLISLVQGTTVPSSSFSSSTSRNPVTSSRDMPKK